MITIVDYGVGNIKAFAHVFQSSNVQFKIATTKEDLLNSERIIFPGVGSFDNAMTLLNKSRMRDLLEKLVIVDKVPILGVCVGMQMFANRSEEGSQEGLGWIDADVCRFPNNIELPVPHMGWNNMDCFIKNDIFNGLDQKSVFYFLHSYYFDSRNESNVLATSEYGINFNSVVVNDNVFGVQFHPEKSHRDGTRLLLNFNSI
jgi:glutamine amidotransferase